MSFRPSIKAKWEGDLAVVAIAGHLSLYRPDSYALAVLQLADSLGGISVDDVNQTLLAGGRRQVARRMLQQAVRDRALEERDGRLHLTKWGYDSLRVDHAAWIECRNNGTWLILMLEGFGPLVENLPVVPVAPFDDKADSLAWQELDHTTIQGGDERYPGLSKLLQDLVARCSLPAWYDGRSEKLLINPLQDNAKVGHAEMKAQISFESDGTGQWRVTDLDLRAKRFLGGIKGGVVGQVGAGVAANFFDECLRRAGYQPVDGGGYLPSADNLAGPMVNFTELSFRHRISLGRWEVDFFGSVRTEEISTALDWFVRYGLPSAGVLSSDQLLKAADDYLRRAGVSPDGLDRAALRAAFRRSLPSGLNRAELSRIKHPLLFSL